MYNVEAALVSLSGTSISLHVAYHDGGCSHRCLIPAGRARAEMIGVLETAAVANGHQEWQGITDTLLASSEDVGIFFQHGRLGRHPARTCLSHPPAKCAKQCPGTGSASESLVDEHGDG